MARLLLLILALTSAAFAQPTIITTSLAAGRVGFAYDTVLGATGGAAPYTWSVIVGSLPASLSLNAGTGEISGTPSVAATTPFTIRCTDSASAHSEQAVSILIVAALTTATSGGMLSLPVSTPGANLLSNPGFETGTLSGWANQNISPGFVADNSQSHSGTWSALLNNAGTMGAPVPALYQTFSLGPGIYSFSGWVKTAGLGGGGSGVRICADLLGCTEVISGTTPWTQYTFNLTTIYTTTTIVFSAQAYGAPPGQAWFDDMTLYQEQYPISTFLLYPNYRGIVFSDQSQIAQFDVTVIPPVGAGAIGTFTTTLKVQDETSLAFVCNISHVSVSHEIIPCDMTGQNAAHTFLATEQIFDGVNTYTSPNFRLSLAAGTTRNAMSLSFDAQNRFNFLGKPTFILGVYDSGEGYFTDEASYVTQFNTLRRLFQAPINFYLNYQYGAAPTSAMLPLMNVLQSRGIYMLTNANCTVPIYTIEAQGFWFTAATDLDVQTRAAHPGFLGYYVADECTAAYAADVFGQRARMVALDLGGSTWATLNRDTSTPATSQVPPFAQVVDVMAQDPYPFFGPGPYDLSQVSTLTIETKNSVKSSRPIATVLQFFQGGGGAPWPTQANLRNMSYMAIADGSNGLVYWELGQGGGALAGICDGSDPAHSPSGSSSWCQAKQDQYAALTNVITELSTLQSPLSSIDDTTSLTGNTQASIHTRVKTVGGVSYLIASNITNGTLSPVFTWHASPGQVLVYNESRSISPSGLTFTDSFSPFAAHVYVLGASPIPSVTKSGKHTLKGKVVIH